MDALPSCCHKAAKKFEALGYSPARAAAKAIAEHGGGHQDSADLQSVEQKAGASFGRPYGK